MAKIFSSRYRTEVQADQEKKSVVGFHFMSGRRDDPSSLRSLDSSFRTSFSYSVSGLSPPLPSSVRLRLLLLASSVIEGEVTPSSIGEVEADAAEGRLPRLLLQSRICGRHSSASYLYTRYNKTGSKYPSPRLTSVLRALFSCVSRGRASQHSGGGRGNMRGKDRDMRQRTVHMHLHPAALSRRRISAKGDRTESGQLTWRGLPLVPSFPDLV